jgi:hypothetical protein
MTKHNVIRILAGLNFLIFFCPFFQMCSDKSMIRKEEETTEETILADEPNEDQIEIIKDFGGENERFITIPHENKTASSGYKLATYVLEPKTLKDIEYKDLLDSNFYAFMLFTLTLIVSIVLFVLSLKKKSNSVYKLALLNLLFAIIPIGIFIVNGVLEEISQIKFGYYLFIINTLALIIFSKKSKSPNAV